MNNKGNAYMLFLLVFNIFLTFVISYAYMELLGTPFTAFFFSPSFAIISQILGFLLPLALWLAVTRDGEPGWLPKKRLGRVNIILIVTLCFCVQPAMMLLSALSAMVFPNTVADALADFQAYAPLLTFCTLTLTPAICEEATFRGYILSRYSHVGLGKAAVINGLFFAMMHLDAQQFLYAFAMGAWFVVLVRCTRSILAGVLAHFSVNAIQWLLHYTWFAAEPSETALVPEAALTFADYVPTLLTLGVATLMLAPVVYMLMRAFITHNRRRHVRMDIIQALRTGEPPASPQADEKNALPPERVLDICFWMTVGVYIAYMVATPLWLGM